MNESPRISLRGPGLVTHSKRLCLVFPGGSASMHGFPGRSLGTSVLGTIFFGIAAPTEAAASDKRGNSGLMEI